MRKILLVDCDAKNIRILKESFLKANYEADCASSDLEALQNAEQHPYDLILSEIAPPTIDGHRLLEKLQRNPNTASIPVVFLTKKSDIWNRARSFRLGAKDFIVKPIHVQEIIARVGMVLSRLERRGEEQVVERKKLVGRLEDINILDLIETFGVDRKTGVLTVNNENGLSGQIFFRDGAVVNANTSDLHAEEALYKMMGWSKGRFSILFTDVDVEDKISISNLGLLIQGEKRMKKRKDMLSQLPPINSVLITTNNFKDIVGQKELTPDVEHFLRLFDGERSLARIIDESPYDDIVTLERILKLHQHGFLRTLGVKGGEEELQEEVMAEDKEGAGISEREPYAEIGHEETIPLHDLQEKIAEIPSSGEQEDVYPEPPKWAISKPSLEEPPPFDEKVPALTEELPTGEKFEKEPAPASEPSFVDETESLDTLGAEFSLEQEEGLFTEYETSQEQETAVPPSDDSAMLTEKEAETKTVATAEEKPIAKTPEEAKPPVKLAQAHVLIIGPENLGIHEVVDSLAAGQCSTITPPLDSVSPIYYATVPFKGGHSLNVLAISAAKEFTPVIDYLAPRTIGYILLVDLYHSKTWNYLSYLVHSLDSKLDVPSMLAAKIEKEKAEAVVRRLQNVQTFEDSKRIYLCESFDTITSKRMIFSLFGVSNESATNIHVVERKAELNRELAQAH